MKGKLFSISYENSVLLLKVTALFLFFSLCFYKRDNISMFSRNLFAFDLPVPTGPFSVGMTSYQVEDASRQEEMSLTGGTHREFMLHVWYPTDGPKEKSKEQYLARAMPFMKAQGSKLYYLPNFVMDFLFSDVHSYAHRDKPLSSSRRKYPIILFSHGFGSLAGMHSTTLEELASHGYIVVGVDHTYDCCVSVFDNGKQVPLFTKWKSKFGRIRDRFSCWVKDLQYVLTFLCKKQLHDTKGLFAGKLDLQRIGVLGHSMGGAVATHICATEGLVKAGVNMDGPIFSESKQGFLEKPFMFLLAEETIRRITTPISSKELKRLHIAPEELQTIKDHYLPAIPSLDANNPEASYLFEVKGAGHNTFCDYPLLKKVSRFFSMFNLGVGTIDPYRALSCMNSYLTHFFDIHLKGYDRRNWQTLQDQYPEVVAFKAKSKQC